jgi:hypothetical protein
VILNSAYWMPAVCRRRPGDALHRGYRPLPNRH